METGRSRRSIPISGALDDRKRASENPRSYEELPEDIRWILMERKSESNEKKGVLQVMEEKHVMTALLFIDEMSPVLKSDVYNTVSRSANMVHKLDEMRAIGLIEIYETARTNSNVIVITDRGHEVAELVRHMIDLINGKVAGGGGQDSLERLHIWCIRLFEPYLFGVPSRVLFLLIVLSDSVFSTVSFFIEGN